MYNIPCSKAFHSPEEATEWSYLYTIIENIDKDAFPICITVNYKENVQRLRRHNYVLEKTVSHNVYKLSLKENCK